MHTSRTYGLIEHLLNLGLYIFPVQTQNYTKLTDIFVMKIVTNIFIAYISPTKCANNLSVGQFRNSSVAYRVGDCITT